MAVIKSSNSKDTQPESTAWLYQLMEGTPFQAAMTARSFYGTQTQELRIAGLWVIVKE
jgi:hypothetical protein